MLNISETIMKNILTLLILLSASSSQALAGEWDLTILHTNSLNGALDNCG